MATAIEKMRTNYIKFADKSVFEKFKNIVNNVCISEDDGAKVYTKDTNDGLIHAMFCANGAILGYSDDSEDPEYDYDAFVHDLQTVIPDGEALLIYTVGFEKLRYVYGDCDVVTNKEWKNVSLEDTALEIAKQLLNDPEWTTQSSY